MDFGRAFSYVMQDQDWLKKVGIAGLIMIIPILGQIVVLGWVLEITKNIINGGPEVLPDWSNFGDFLSRGFQAFVIAFAYSLPVILISFCLGTLVGVLSSQTNNDSAQTMATVIQVLNLCINCVVFIYDIALGIFLPAAIGNFVASGQIGAGFRFNEIFGLVKAAPGPYIIVFLLSIVTGIISALGLIACVIGVLFTTAYASTVNAHLWGQAYKAAKGTTTPAAPVVATPTM